MDGEVITSRQNRNVVELCKLTDRKRREELRLFRFDGWKLFEEAVKNGVALDSIFIRESLYSKLSGRMESLIERSDEARMSGVPSGERFFGRKFLLSDEVFDKISEEKSPEGIICVAKYIDKLQKFVTIYNSEDFLNAANERIVLVESVRDPVNIGAVIRSAAALGIDRLIFSADCADIYHPRAVRASMGAVFNQRIDRTDSLPEAIRALQSAGRRVFAAALDRDARRLGAFQTLPGDCVVIGNEGHGLSAETLSASSHRVYIPMTDRAESFNAAVAASILMWEFAK